MVRQVIVFDTTDLHAESAFWAGILGGRVFEDDRWHSVTDAAGEWRIGVQLAPKHIPPDRPDDSPQQVHLDLHVDDPRVAHKDAMALGARLFQPLPTSMPTAATRHTPTRPDIRFASDGGIRLEMRSGHSSPSAVDDRVRDGGCFRVCRP
jgi:hypothetical protein